MFSIFLASSRRVYFNYCSWSMCVCTVTCLSPLKGTYATVSATNSMTLHPPGKRWWCCCVWRKICIHSHSFVSQYHACLFEDRQREVKECLVNAEHMLSSTGSCDPTCTLDCVCVRAVSLAPKYPEGAISHLLRFNKGLRGRRGKTNSHSHLLFSYSLHSTTIK